MIEEKGWDLTVELDKAAPPGEFAVYLGEELIFSRYAHGKLPNPLDVIPLIHTRLFGYPA